MSGKMILFGLLLLAYMLFFPSRRWAPGEATFLLYRVQGNIWLHNSVNESSFWFKPFSPAYVPDLAPNDSAVSPNENHPQSMTIYHNWQKKSKVYICLRHWIRHQKRNFHRVWSSPKEMSLRFQSVYFRRWWHSFIVCISCGVCWKLHVMTL